MNVKYCFSTISGRTIIKFTIISCVEKKTCSTDSKKLGKSKRRKRQREISLIKKYPDMFMTAKSLPDEE